MEEKICPCRSGNSYQECCEPYHEGTLPETAERLMRSRYSAYALDLPDYIIETTHPASPEYDEDIDAWREDLSNVSKNCDFRGLEVLEVQEGEHTAIVTFVAHLFQGKNDQTFTERSFFVKAKNRWLYRFGQLESGKDLSLVLNKPMKILPIAYYGEKVLRDQALPILKVTDEIRELVSDMIETMDVNEGMGLAAPQVHYSLQIFVMRPPEDKLGERHLGDVEVYLNPKIISKSSETSSISEACISIPKLQGNVVRPKEITVQYMDLDGKTHETKLDGWRARIAQHEMDHLAGILFIDRVDERTQKRLKKPLKNLKKRMEMGHVM